LAPLRELFILFKSTFMFRKKIYTWHRTLSLIIAIPVLLWAVSGFMHPLMTNIRPKVFTQKLPPVAIDSKHIRVPLSIALQKNHITDFHSVRLIHIDTNFFYQVQQTVNKAPVYLSTYNGKLLPSGDWLYAQYLARQFLDGPPSSSPVTAAITPVAVVEEEGHDCCNAATACVLKNSTGSKIGNVSRLTSFNEEYKSINRLLPVYRISFNRPDGIRVYVETTQDRFAFAMDNKRAVYDTIFQWFHTWSWLDALGNAKLVIIIAISLLAFCTSLLGIYIFCISKTKKPNKHTLLKARRNHRYTAITAAVFTLAWSFSGAWHALAKFEKDNRDDYFINNSFSPDVDFNFTRLQQLVHQPISNINLVKMNNGLYWRITMLPATAHHSTSHKMDGMKNTEAVMPLVTLVNAAGYSILPKGEEKYAAYLAGIFSNHPTNDIQQVTPVTKFNDEYNFTDKRLPVWKVSYALNNNERYYIETSSGKLSVRVDDTGLAEGYSFALFHKHHFMDWAGKKARDASTMVWAAMQVLMVAVGLILWWRAR
jgi:hypothetical protein